MKAENELNVERMFEKIQAITLDLLQTKSELEKTKNELARTRMQVLRVEKTQLLTIAMNQKQTTMLISNFIETEIKENDD